jgi:glycosyltransferase involved in cell wall biosynthesis
MLIAIVHYHLNPGGVTQVIANQLRALALQPSGGEPVRVVVLHGGRCAGWPARLPEASSLDYAVQPLPGLDYDDQPRDAGELAARLQAVLRAAGGTSDTTVIHVHNHALGKNVTLPAALGELARGGWPLLLQLHDFAEDFRPDNYRQMAAGGGGCAAAETAASVYPSAAHVHYAVLNQRDARILAAADVAPDRLHVLPNAVGDVAALPPRESARQELARRCGIPEHRRLLLYPVRGIRRKNLGEALLWSVLAGDHWQVALTLAPLTAAERPSYERWKGLAASLGLRMAFETGEASGLSYADNLAAADRMLTTSVAEGFGLVFLETWLAGKTLVGRDLPEITADFVAAGLRLEHLRPRLNVPVDWIGVACWRHDFEQAYRETLARFGQPAPAAEDLSRTLEQLIDGGQVDFAALSSQQQQRVVQQAAESERRRQRLRALNEWIEVALASPRASAEAVAQNAAAVRAMYSLAACGRRLRDLYRSVAACPRGGEVQPLPRAGQILDEFLRPERFQPIRIEP